MPAALTTATVAEPSAISMMTAIAQARMIGEMFRLLVNALM